MPGRFIIPDPKDRSANAPSVMVSSAQVLGYYNKINSDDKKERVVESVQTWYIAQAKLAGWTKARFHGNQCALEVTVKVG